MIYEYLLTAFKLIVGLITTERLIYGAAIALGVYLVWICFSLMFCYQKKFSKNCVKLYNFIKKNNINADNANSIDVKVSKISSGFSHGWKKFKSSAVGKPSDFINRRDALDVDVSGGVLNQGKTIMRSFINIATFILFLLNFAYLGNASSVSYYLLAEAMVLPLVFFMICKIFYFIYTSIKQQLYKNDIECLYELLDLLDGIFAKASAVPATMAVQEQTGFIQGEDEVATTDGEQLEVSETAEVENQEQTDDVKNDDESAEEEAEEDSVASKYDIFKKKNIDVDKILNEVPENKSSLPYINVDSDYVITDEVSNAAVSKTITNLDNGSALLGGMMQDMSSIKNAQKEAEKLEAEKLEAEKLETEKQEAAEEEKKKEVEENKESAKEVKTEDSTDDPFDSLGAFEIAENAPAEEVKESNADEAVEVKEEPAEEKKEEPAEEVKLEIPDVEPIEIVKPEPEVVSEPEETDELTEEQRENIATVVGSFKPKSKLASGGVVIERNQPIARREKASYDIQQEEYDDGYNEVYEEDFAPHGGITHLSVEDNADNILNSFRSSAGAYEEYPTYNNMQGGMYNQGYGAPQYNQGYGYPQTGFNQPMPGYGVQGYQNQPNQGFNSYQNEQYDEEYEDYDEVEEDEQPVKKAAKKPAAKRSKEDEPRPRNLKKKESKPVMTEEVKSAKRGRPKKQVFDDSISIKNDKEFDEVLSRAEKLMRKSEEGLSASQSKRIEKELKMLMDAMNRYKEGV